MQKSSIIESLEAIQNLSILVVFWLVIDLSFERQESTYTDKNCVYFTEDKTGPALFLWSALHKHFLVEWQQHGYLFCMKIQFLLTF